MSWLLKLITEPIRCSINGLLSAVTCFTVVPRWIQAAALFLTAALAMLFPVGLAVASMSSLSYNVPGLHPLLHMGWDLAVLLMMVQVAQVSAFVLLPLCTWSLAGLLWNLQSKARAYAHEEEI